MGLDALCSIWAARAVGSTVELIPCTCSESRHDFVYKGAEGAGIRLKTILLSVGHLELTRPSTFTSETPPSSFLQQADVSQLDIFLASRTLGLSEHHNVEVKMQTRSMK